MPVTYWLSGFFFVQSFLTAGLQNYARKHKMPIDMVTYEYEMLGTDESEYTERPEAGVYAYGLFLEGCAWDAKAKMLCESQPKTLFVTAPCMFFKPVEASAVSTYPHYQCPVYRTAERRGVLATTGHSTNFVMFVKMPSDVPQSHWVMRGVAMLSQLSD
jgi:dynein heavy chain